MRYFDYRAWVQTYSRTLYTDPETLHLKLADPDAVLLALRAAGGQPVSDDDAQDTAEAAFRLLQHLTLIPPVIVRRREAAAYAATVQLAANRGWKLRLANDGAQLMAAMEADADPEPLIRAIRHAMTPSPQTKIDFQEKLRGVTVCLSHAVTNPTPELEAITDFLTRKVSKNLRAAGAQVLQPDPVDHVGGDNRRDRRWRSKGRARSARTHEILTRSLQRISRAHVLVLISDPRSQGCVVEREWALRRGIPIIELPLHDGLHPHQDGPNCIWTVPVNLTTPQDALELLDGKIAEVMWAIRDQVAISESIARMNEVLHARLRGSWETLNARQRNRIARSARMSRPFIEGILYSPNALELTSALQLRGLQLLLEVPREVRSTPVLSDHQMKLLGDAADAQGLRGGELLRTVHVAELALAQSNLRGRLTEPAQAQALISDAIRRLREADSGPDDEPDHR